jgi:hypothetical protein
MQNCSYITERPLRSPETCRTRLRQNKNSGRSRSFRGRHCWRRGTRITLAIRHPLQDHLAKGGWMRCRFKSLAATRSGCCRWLLVGGFLRSAEDFFLDGGDADFELKALVEARLHVVLHRGETARVVGKRLFDRSSSALSCSFRSSFVTMWSRINSESSWISVSSSGRVEDGRGSLGPMASAPFPIPAHQTERADFRHSAFRLASPQGPRWSAARCWCPATTPRHVTYLRLAV